MVKHGALYPKLLFIEEQARRQAYRWHFAPAEGFAGAEFADSIEACAAELSGHNDKIDGPCIQKIERVSSDLVFDTVGEPRWADQVQRRCPMQANPEQPIDAGKMVHLGMRYKSM